MSAYTKRLRDAVEEIDDIGLSDYPIYDESYRSKLNKKILDFYAYWEIGSETVEMFAHNLRNKMHRIMPYYNEMYRSLEYKFNPITNARISTVVENKSVHTGNAATETGSMSNADTKSDARSVSSEYPQNSLSADSDYATSSSDTHGLTSANSTTSETGKTNSADASNSNSESLVEGYSGVSAASLLQEFRAAIINVDSMIIGDLESLFMGLWNTLDPYTKQYWYDWI